MKTKIFYTFRQAAKIINIEKVGQSRVFNILWSLGIVNNKDGHYKAIRKLVTKGYFDYCEPTTGGYRQGGPELVVVGQKGLDFLKKTVEDYYEEHPRSNSSLGTKSRSTAHV